MDCAKIGKLILQLRKEKGLTQQNIAEALNITNKTISKWECGIGCPDLSLWPALSEILGFDIVQMMDGEITPNKPDSGNINRIRFYVCPSCGNILVSTGGATIFCCGRKLEQASPATEDNLPNIIVENLDDDYYVNIDHPMTKEHYISFVAYVKSDKIFIYKLYPEQSCSLHIPPVPRGKLFVYCVSHGLMLYKNIVK